MASEWDRLLEAALVAYADQEPRPGLEGRVLARVRGQGRRARAGWMAFVTAAALITAVLVYWPRRVEELPLPKTTPVRNIVLPVEQPPPAAMRAAAPLNRVQRLERFPGNSPLTQEERLLLLLTRSPEHASSLLADRHGHGIEPIDIKELQVPALNTDEQERAK